MIFPVSSSRSSFLFEHDLFRKPLHTFRDHALSRRAFDPLAGAPQRGPVAFDPDRDAVLAVARAAQRHELRQSNGFAVELEERSLSVRKQRQLELRTTIAFI